MQEAENPSLSKTPDGDFMSLNQGAAECPECGAPGFIVPPKGHFVHETETDMRVCHMMR